MSQEQKRQELRELLELRQMPGWVAFRQLLERVCQRKNVERSNRLRKGSLHDAVIMQGEIDGITNVPAYLENYIRELETPDEED